VRLHGRDDVESFYFFAALIFAHLAFAKADSLALAAALILNFFLTGLTALAAGFVALTLAQRALAAAEILALADVLILRLCFGAGVITGLVEKPKTWLNSFSRASIFSLRFAAWRNCWTDS
jgi:hypothetical protein